LALAANFQSFS